MGAGEAAVNVMLPVTLLSVISLVVSRCWSGETQHTPLYIYQAFIFYRINDAKQTAMKSLDSL